MSETEARQALRLADVIDRLTLPGELYRPLEGGKVECHACGHRCVIFPGKRGVCKIRFNADGTPRVPWGYVAALQCDPTEKKPFNHVLPGSSTLTFGMLGCDYHCPYCLPGSTILISDRGPLSLEEAFRTAENTTRTPDAEIAYVDLRAVTGSGKVQPIRAIFKHRYWGALTVIRPYYLPELHCTPDHRVYATTDPSTPLEKVEAGRLTDRHYLAIPRRHAFSTAQELDAFQILHEQRVTHRVHWKLSREDRQTVVAATLRGETSRQIGEALGKSASYIRHVRRKVLGGRETDSRTHGPLKDGDAVRFPRERQPGIPRRIPLDEHMARLLGYYCAEGTAARNGDRPNSHTVEFAFSPTELKYAEEVQGLLRRCLGIKAAVAHRDTVMAVSASKASAALLFRMLAGGGGGGERGPRPLSRTPPGGRGVSFFLPGRGRAPAPPPR